MVEDIFDLVRNAGDKCLDFLTWYDEVEELWKLLLIPVCILAYTGFIFLDAIEIILFRIGE